MGEKAETWLMKVAGFAPSLIALGVAGIAVFMLVGIGILIGAFLF